MKHKATQINQSNRSSNEKSYENFNLKSTNLVNFSFTWIQFYQTKHTERTFATLPPVSRIVTWVSKNNI